MRRGRTGIFIDDEGALRVGVVSQVNHNSVEVSYNGFDEETQTTTVARGEFHKLDESHSGRGINSIREHFDISLDSYSGVRRPEPVSQGFRPSTAEPVTPSDNGFSVEGDVVTFGEAFITALTQVFRQLTNKKKVTGVYNVAKGSKKGSKKTSTVTSSNGKSKAASKK